MTTINAVSPFMGVLAWVGQPREGVSQSTGNAWKSVEFTIKYLDSQMQEQYMNFSLTGAENVDRLLATPLNTEIIVTWRPGARQYNNPATGQVTWFPQNNSFGFRLAKQTAQEQAAPAPAAQPAPKPQAKPAPAAQAAPAPSDDPMDDIPF